MRYCKPPATKYVLFVVVNILRNLLPYLIDCFHTQFGTKLMLKVQTEIKSMYSHAYFSILFIFFFYCRLIQCTASVSEDEGEKADCCPAGGTAEVFRQLSGPASSGQGMDEKRI